MVKSKEAVSALQNAGMNIFLNPFLKKFCDILFNRGFFFFNQLISYRIVHSGKECNRKVSYVILYVSIILSFYCLFEIGTWRTAVVSECA